MVASYLLTVPFVSQLSVGALVAILPPTMGYNFEGNRVCSTCSLGLKGVNIAGERYRSQLETKKWEREKENCRMMSLRNDA